MASYVPPENYTYRSRSRFEFPSQEIQALEPNTLNLKNLLFWRSMMLAQLAEKDLLNAHPGDLYDLTITRAIADGSDR